MLIRPEDPDILPRDFPSNEDSRLGKDVPRQPISFRTKEALVHNPVTTQQMTEELDSGNCEAPVTGNGDLRQQLMNHRRGGF